MQSGGPFKQSSSPSSWTTPRGCCEEAAGVVCVWGGESASPKRQAGPEEGQRLPPGCKGCWPTTPRHLSACRGGCRELWFVPLGRAADRACFKAVAALQLPAAPARLRSERPAGSCGFGAREAPRAKPSKGAREGVTECPLPPPGREGRSNSRETSQGPPGGPPEGGAKVTLGPTSPSEPRST